MSALFGPGAVHLHALDADVRERSWKAGIEEEGLEALFEFASDDAEAALCFFKDGFEDRDARLARVAVDERGRRQRSVSRAARPA